MESNKSTTTQLGMMVMITVVIALLMLLLFGLGRTDAEAGTRGVVTDPTELFTDVPGATCQDVGENIHRSRPVDINFSALTTTDSFSFETTYHDIVTLNLFPTGTSTVTVAAELNELAFATDGSAGYSWLGEVSGESASSVSLNIYESAPGVEALAGTVSMTRGLFSITMDPSGDFHCITQINQRALMANENDGATVFTSVNGEGRQARLMQHRAPDDGSLIDVLVVYTPQAKQDAGGEAAIQGTIRNFISSLNLSAENSQLAVNFSLVHMAETNFSRTGTSYNDLVDLARPNDGKMDDVQTLRDTYHADIVLLYVRNSKTGDQYDTGGIGFISTGPTAQWADPSRGYGLGTLNCGLGSCMVHEAGHVMGLRHDWYKDTNTQGWAYNKGFTAQTNAMTTIMAYNDHCKALGKSCQGIFYFSNPSVNINGEALGVTHTGATNCNKGQTSPNPSGCAADNSRALDITRKIVAQYRTSKIVWTGDVSSDWHTANNWEIEEGEPGATKIVNRVPRSIDDVIIPANPNGGRMPTLNGSMSVRNLEIETGAAIEMTGGVLNVSGNWVEQGSGKFIGRAGKVTFNGSFPQTVTMGASSSLPNTEIGAGGDTTIKLASNVDINGDLTIMQRAALEAASHTLNVAGNWDEKGPGFTAGTSTVVLDGTADKTLDKVTEAVVMSEDFSRADGVNGLTTSKFPAGWDPGYLNNGIDFWVGGNIGNPDGAAQADQPNGSLYSRGVFLKVGQTYELKLDAKYDMGSDTLQIYYGDGKTLGQTTTLIKSHTLTAAFQTYSATFTVPSNGKYYLRFQSVDGTAIVDNVVLTGKQNLSFYNLQLAEGKATFNEVVEVVNNLQIDANARAVVSDKAFSVDGTVTNDGTIEQTLTADSGTVAFAHIQNKAGSADAYRGVDISPTGGALGSTTVAVHGNAACLATATPNIVNRCYDITPATANAATVRLYYRSAEANSNTTPNVYHYNTGNSTWEQEGGTVARGGSGDAVYVEVTDVDQYSRFAASDATPNAAPGAAPVVPPPNASIADVAVSEGAGNATLTVALSAASARDVTVDYATSNASATAGQDYTTKSGTLTIAAGQTSGTIDVAILDDVNVESAETLKVSLTSSNIANITTADATVTINDNDVAASAISIADVSVAENGAQATLTVSLGSASTQVVSADYATSNDSALAGSDYVAKTGSVSIPVGQTTASIVIDITNDTVDESDETFKVTLSNPANGTLGTAVATVTITDEDSAPSARIADATVSESIGKADVTISLSHASASKVSFDVATSNDTATAGQDFTALSAAVVIQPGQTQATVQVDITDDSMTESAETFKVTLSNPQNATLADAEATISITDNDTGTALGNRILNPLFNDTSKWTVEVGTSFDTTNSACGTNVAHLEDSFGSANVEQCIVVSAHATNWMLAGDMRVTLADNTAELSAAFYQSADCSGTETHTESLSTASQTMQMLSKQFTYDTSANNIGSIKVNMSATYTGTNFQDVSDACFDNLSLQSGGATQPAITVFIPIVVR